MGDRPKRPLCSYMMFVNDNREIIKRENSGMKITEIAKRCGELWRALEDKSVYQMKADAAKLNYNKLMKEFEDLNGPTTGRKRKMATKNSGVKKGKTAEIQEDPLTVNYFQ